VHGSHPKSRAPGVRCHCSRPSQLTFPRVSGSPVCHYHALSTAQYQLFSSDSCDLRIQRLCKRQGNLGPSFFDPDILPEDCGEEVRWFRHWIGSKCNKRWKTRTRFPDDQHLEWPRPPHHVTVSIYIYGPHAVTSNSLLLSNHHHPHTPPNRTNPQPQLTNDVWPR